MSNLTTDSKAQVLDSKHLGRLLRAARIAAGYSTAAEAAAALGEAAGSPVTERVLGALERGETTASFEFIVLFCSVMTPIDGLRPFLQAINEPFRQNFRVAALRAGR